MTDKKPPRARKSAPDATSWTQLVRRPATPEPTPEPAAELPAPALRPARRRPRLARFPATYRLPADVLELIDDAVDAAAERGERLTKEGAVEAAIRGFYGELR